MTDAKIVIERRYAAAISSLKEALYEADKIAEITFCESWARGKIADALDLMLQEQHKVMSK